jgi:hypothetical protein
MLNDKENTVALYLINTITDLDSLDNRFNTLFETEYNVLSEISRKATDALLTLVGVPEDGENGYMRDYWYSLVFDSNPSPEPTEFLQALLEEVEKQKV